MRHLDPVTQHVVSREVTAHVAKAKDGAEVPEIHNCVLGHGIHPLDTVRANESLKKHAHKLVCHKEFAQASLHAHLVHDLNDHLAVVLATVSIVEVTFTIVKLLQYLQ